MLKRRWLMAAALLVGMAALTMGAQETDVEEPQPVKAKGVIEELTETDDGDVILTLRTDDDTILMLHLEPTTEVWYGDTKASTDVLWDEVEAEVEVEYVVLEELNLLKSVRFPSDIEE